MSDFTEIVVPIGVVLVLIGVVVGGFFWLAGRVKKQMAAKAAMEESFIAERGLARQPDGTITGVVDGISVRMGSAWNVFPATGVGEGSYRSKSAKVETFQVLVGYPGSPEWFLCEPRTNKPYVDDEERPVAWLSYHMNKLGIPESWQPVSIENPALAKHYVMLSEDGSAPAMPTEQEVYRAILHFDVPFIVAKGGHIAIWANHLNVEEDFLSPNNPLEALLKVALSLCKPDSV